MRAQDLVRRARERQEISLEQLAVRAGLSPASVARIEAGQETPDTPLLETLLLVCGEELVAAEHGRLDSRELRRSYDAERLVEQLHRPMAARIEEALGWNRFADELYRAGRDAS